MTTSSRPLPLGLALALLAACSAPPAEEQPACSTSADCSADEICRGGACEAPGDPCPPLLSCADGCKDGSTDPLNCGGCGVTCAAGAACLGSACCPAEAPAACDGLCVDLAADDANCGACGSVCPGDLHCSGGSCCAAGETLCPGGCRALASDPGACGACGQLCAAGASCVDGGCDSCPPGTTEVACDSLTACLPDTGPQDLPCRLEVPTGPFTLGAPFNDGVPEDVDDYSPPHEVTLSRAFFLDLTEETRAAYGSCVDAGACTLVDGLDVAHRAGEPVVNLTWLQAQALCAFRGGRLPTEAEWEKAARGPDGRRYPWGEGRPDCRRGATERCTDLLSAVGRFPLGAGPYGHLDLWGNAAEWVADLYDLDAYRRGEDVDPVGPQAGTDRVYRSPSRGQGQVPVFHRWHREPGFLQGELSVRCAYDR